MIVADILTGGHNRPGMRRIAGRMEDAVPDRIATRDDMAVESIRAMLAERLGRPRRPGEPEPELLEIRDYRMGDISSPFDVSVTAGSLIAGNISASRLMVAGMVHGALVARELRIESSGQVWGDVYASSIIVAPEGKLYGWVTIVDEGTIDLLRAGELGRGDVKSLPAVVVPPALQEAGAALRASSESGPAGVDETTRVRLQAELATSLMARAELEAAVEARAVELASGADLGSAGPSERIAEGSPEGPETAPNGEQGPASGLARLLDRLHMQEDELAASQANLAILEAALALKESELSSLEAETERRHHAFGRLARFAADRIRTLEREVAKTREPAGGREAGHAN
jgi:hypothetical protein